MHSFYCLHDAYYPGVAERIESLKNACSKRQVRFFDMDCSTFNHLEVPQLSENDMMYNVARGGEEMENLFLHTGVKTFYKDPPLFIFKNSDTVKYSLIHSKQDLPAPKTVFHSTNEDGLLRAYTKFLGGFPLVLKTYGGTRGVGAIYISDHKNLKSIADLLVSRNEAFILREYIQAQEIARLIVIGNKVIASNAKQIPRGDFRSSVQNRLPEPKIYNEDIQHLAVKASHSANFLNCGVDILIDQSGEPFLLEVNMPHDFTTTEKSTGIDIAGAMIDLLLNT